MQQGTRLKQRQGPPDVASAEPVGSTGRHFLGSNYFWYFRDPAGHMAEYFADLDQIDDDEWTTGEWGAEKSLYSWGPPVPKDFVEPPDIEELSTAYAKEMAARRH